MAKRKRVPQPAAFQQGDCLAVDLDDGTWTAALVLGVVDASNGDGWPIVAGLNWRGHRPPVLEDFRTAMLLRDDHDDPDVSSYPGGPYDGQFAVSVVGHIAPDLSRFPVRCDVDGRWQMTETFGEPVEPGGENPVSYQGWDGVGFTMSTREEERPDLPAHIECDDDILTCERPLSEVECRSLNAYLVQHPDAELWVSSRYRRQARPNLDMFDHLPALRRLHLVLDRDVALDLAPLAVLPAGLKSLFLGAECGTEETKNDKPKRNIAVLERLAQLRELDFYGQLADLDFLSRLPALRSLGLRKTKLKSLSGIEVQTGLEELELNASGAKDLTPVASLRNLRKLSIWDHRSLKSYQPIVRLPRLRRLDLISSKTEAPLPSLAGLPELRILNYYRAADTRDLERIAEAPGLRILALLNSPASATVDALRPLQGHKTLREVRVSCSNRSTLAAIRAAYGWSVAGGNFATEEDLVDP